MNSGDNLPILPTWSAITEASGSTRTTPLGIDIQIFKRHLHWAVPSVVCAILFVLLLVYAYKRYKKHKMTGRWF